MAAALLPDPLCDLVEPFLPIPPRPPKGGQPRVSDRACLTGIVPLSRVRADLLAVAAQDVEGHLKPMPPFPALVRQKAVLLWKSRPYGCLAAFRGASHGNRSTLRRYWRVNAETAADLRQFTIF